MNSTKSLTDSIGQRLRLAREQAGLSQGQVARMIDYHRPTISQIEADKRSVRADEIAKFSEIYGIKEAWIVGGDSALEEGNDPRVELAARELARLKSEDLDAILRLIKLMRNTEE